MQIPIMERELEARDLTGRLDAERMRTLPLLQGRAPNVGLRERWKVV